jgi:hypothetical protein
MGDGRGGKNKGRRERGKGGKAGRTVDLLALRVGRGVGSEDLGDSLQSTQAVPAKGRRVSKGSRAPRAEERR